MGRRLTESFKLLEKDYRLKERKAKYEKTIPSFKNLSIDVHFKDELIKVRIKVTNLLNVGENPFYTTISSIKPSRSNYLITSIICPICGKKVQINKYWNCYICNCSDHNKKVFEIKKALLPESQQVKEMPSSEE